MIVDIVHRNQQSQLDTQKCFVSSALLSDYGLAAGSWVLLQRDNITTLNRVFCDRSLRENVCWTDAAVVLPSIGVGAVPGCLNSDRFDQCFRPLSHVSTLAAVTATVVFSSVEGLHSAVKCVCHRVERSTTLQQPRCALCGVSRSVDLQYIVSSLLHGRGVSAVGQTVFNCSFMSLARRHGISSLRICSSTPSSDISVGVIQRGVTDLSIDEVVTEEYISFFDRCFPVCGHAEARRRLLRVIRRQRGKCAPVSVLLMGPVGCGKCTLVQSICQSSGVYVMVVRCGDILTTRTSNTNTSVTSKTDSHSTVTDRLLHNQSSVSSQSIASVFARARLYSTIGQPVTILLLGLDQVHSPAVARQLAHEMQAVKSSTSSASTAAGRFDDVQRLFIVATASYPQRIHQLLRTANCFPLEMYVTIGTQEDRVAYLDQLLSEIDFAGDLSVNELASRTPGFSVADLRSVLQQALLFSLTDTEPHSAITDGSSSGVSGQRPLLTAAAVFRALSVAQSSSVRSVGGAHVIGGDRSCPSAGTDCWSGLAGLDSVISRLLACLETPLVQPDACRRLLGGAPNPTGVLLYGPPGCAKTSLVRAAAARCRAVFLSVSAADIYSPYVGDAERMVAEVFTHARMVAPAVIFLDELDALVGARSQHVKACGVQAKVLAALLNEMDGIGAKHNNMASLQCPVFVVGATNRRDLIDEALLRPGRLDQHIHVPLPDAKSRKQIINLYTRRSPLAPDVDVDELSALTDRFSGADLQQVCNQAALAALTDSMHAKCIKHRHFLQTIENM